MQPVLAPIATAPEILATLPKGTVLSGSVLAAEQSAGLQVLTKYGTIELDAKLALVAGTKVALQLREGGQLHLQIIRSDAAAAPPEGTAKALADAAIRLPNQVLTATLESAVLANLSKGEAGAASGAAPVGFNASSGNLTGVHSQGLGTAALAQLPPALRHLAVGTQFQIQITAINTNTSTKAVGAGQQAVVSGGPSVQPAAASPAPPSTSGSPSRAASASSAPQAASTSDPIVAGSVVASAAKGKPVIQTSFGIISLSEPLQLPLGARVRIHVLSNSLPQFLQGALPMTDPMAQRLTDFSAAWPSLNDLAKQNQEGRIPSALASQIMQRVPTAGPNLSANILFLMSALNAGQLSGWLGRPALDQMQRDGHGDLAARLDNELSQVGRVAEINTGEWRTLILPFLDDGQIRQLRLFIRRRDEDAEGDSEAQSSPDATRFLLEIELSKLGDLQLDGLIRSKLFDLILRTRQPFSHAMREEIIRIFNESNHSLGLAGQILFEASDQWRSTTEADAELQDPPNLLI